jgi:hypothetical protein
MECPDCGGTVSKRAANCPHCGAPIAAGEAHTPTSGDAASTTNGDDQTAVAPIVQPEPQAGPVLEVKEAKVELDSSSVIDDSQQKTNKQQTENGEDRQPFADWHKQRFSVVHELPPVVCCVINCFVWTCGCGFIWIPLWYLYSQADGADFVSKAKSIGKMIPVGQCPSCKENWVKEVLQKKRIGTRQAHRTVTRKDEHRAMNPKGGDGSTMKVGETRRQEQISVTVNTYRLTCRCKKCSHTWNETIAQEL